MLGSTSQRVSAVRSLLGPDDAMGGKSLKQLCRKTRGKIVLVGYVTRACYHSDTQGAEMLERYKRIFHGSGYSHHK